MRIEHQQYAELMQKYKKLLEFVQFTCDFGCVCDDLSPPCPCCEAGKILKDLPPEN